MYLRGERDSSSVRRNAIMNYKLGRSHADPVHSFYICITLFISTRVRRRVFTRKQTIHGFGENAMIRYALDSSHTDRVVFVRRNVEQRFC